MAFQGIGSGLQAASAYNNSQGTKTAYAAQGKINENNAQMAEWRAQDALARGGRSMYATGLKTKALKGAQRARLAANGVDLGVGSALEILTDTDYFGQVDQDTVMDNAQREAWALRNEAQNFRSEADLMRSRAASERPALAAGTSLLTSAGRVAGNWYGSGSGSTRGYRVPTYDNPEY